MEKYNLILSFNNEYVVLGSGVKEYCEMLLKWYLAHKQFFNGVFSIVKAEF